MYKIAVMGDRDSIYGFAAIGMEPFVFTEKEKAGEKLQELAKNGYGIIYITEELGGKLEEEIAFYRKEHLPAVILIPGVSKNTGHGMKAVQKSVIQAVGSDIVFGEDK